MHAHDTIVALATAAGPAARLIVRTSGPAAFEMAAARGAPDLSPGRATAVRLTFAGLELSARCLVFRGPRSHTGEDIVEYHLPGNPLLGRLLIDALVEHGGRQAQPGEFSARAFFNGKLRLDEAEGVAAVIGASNERELSAARKLRAGELARRLEPSLEELADLLALCELGIDFSEENVIVLDPADARRRIARLHEQLGRLLAESPRLEQLGQPPRIALVGWPNAGKSTLLNALAGYRRAVASEQAGTTRDALAVDVELVGGRVTLLDLAGLGGDPTGALDSEARRRASQEAATADLLVLIHDATDERGDPPLPHPPDLRVHAKLDLRPELDAGGGDIAVSARTGSGLDALRLRLNEAAFSAPGGAESLALGARHRVQIGAALAAFDAATAAVDTGAGAEVLALHLREALDALGAILGVVSPDELLGRIFGRFCIGK